MDKQNKGDGIKIVISFILILALGVSMFAIIKSGDKLLSNLDSYLGITTAPGTSVVPGTSGNSGTSGMPQQTTKDPYIVTEPSADIHMYDGGTGWTTVGDITYFFRKYSFEYGEYKCFVIKSVADYEDYSGVIRHSQNGIDWEISVPNDMNQITINPYMYQVVYVSYTCIQNCSNPEQVARDLSGLYYNTNYFDIDFYNAVGDGSGTSPS